jgi:DNA-directed RNA polymerase III subunit RPC6
MLVYQVIEKAGNRFVSLPISSSTSSSNVSVSPLRGIWTRDMKNATNIPQQTLTKTLKILEQRNLVKFVRAVTSKSKKLYMLYDTVPAKDITGGPWYTDQVYLTLCPYLLFSPHLC